MADRTHNLGMALFQCLAFLLGLLLAVVILSPIIVLIWAIIRYGESEHDVVLQCSDRAQERGFIGNSDFYGLGIRMGIYLQWAGSLIANAALPGERRSMAGTYVAFSVALLVALLLLVFRRECAFTAEIIILINILYGGALLVLMPYLAKSGGQLVWDDLKGLETVGVLLFLPVFAISTWFWIRLATVGEVDFAMTPGGTSFFLFAYVSPPNLGSATRFMSFLCLWFIGTPLCGGILALLQKIEIQSRLRYLLYILPALGNAYMVLYCFGWIYGFILGVAWRISRTLRLRLTGRPAQRSIDGDIEDKLPEDLLIATLGLIIYVWLIIAIELTLKWNAVVGVYLLNSTSQVIPLVLGLGIMMNITWKIFHPEKTTSGSDSVHDIEMQGALQDATVTTSFQQLDGSWQ